MPVSRCSAMLLIQMFLASTWLSTEVHAASIAHPPQLGPTLNKAHHHHRPRRFAGSLRFQTAADLEDVGFLDWLWGIFQPQYLLWPLHLQHARRIVFFSAAPFTLALVAAVGYRRLREVSFARRVKALQRAGLLASDNDDDDDNENDGSGDDPVRGRGEPRQQHAAAGGGRGGRLEEFQEASGSVEGREVEEGQEVQEALSTTPPQQQQQQQQQQQLPDAADGRGTPSPWIWVVATLLSFAVHINFSISMPMAADVANFSGGTVLMSGFFISAWAFGAALGLPYFYRAGCSRIKSCYLVHSSCIAAGALLEVLLLGAFVGRGRSGWHLAVLPWLMVSARLLQGLGAGVHYTCALAMDRACKWRVGGAEKKSNKKKKRNDSASSAAASVAATEDRTFCLEPRRCLMLGNAAGMVLGPFCSSAAESLAHAMGWGGHPLLLLMAPSLLLTCYGAISGTIIYQSCPDDDYLELQCGGPTFSRQSQGSPTASGWQTTSFGTFSSMPNPEQDPEDALARARAELGMVLLFSSQLTRSLLKMVWESGALLLLQAGEATRVDAGFLVSLVAVGFGLLQALHPLDWRLFSWTSTTSKKRRSSSSSSSSPSSSSSSSSSSMAMMLVGDAPPHEQEAARTVTVLELLSLFGLGVMLCGGTSCFLLGSLLFYSATMASSDPVSEVCAGLIYDSCSSSNNSSNNRAGAGQRKGQPCFPNTETSLLINKCIWLLSCMLAPIYSRGVIHFGAATPPALVTMMFPIAVCQFLITELGLRGRRLREEPQPWMFERTRSISM